jgi:clan AA aspartic protease
MITGAVNANLEARIPLLLQDASGGNHHVDAAIDTGFSGFLTLPSALITSLNLAWLCRQQGLLADSSVQVFDVYMATVLWDGQSRVVEVERIDAVPLVGMEMLHGFELRVKVIRGGAVVIDAAP